MRFGSVGVFVLLLLIHPIVAQTNSSNAVTLHEADVSAGYVLFTILGEPETHLIDNDGNIVNQWQRQSGAMMMPYLLPDGHLLSTVRLNPDSASPVRSLSGLELYDWAGHLVWSYEPPDNRLLHHDIAPMPSGNILVSAFERVTPAQQRELGITPNEEENDLFYDVIMEVERETGDILWQWRVLDHLVQDEYPDAPTYGLPADFPHKLDPQYTTMPHRPNMQDRTHINGLAYNAALDQVLVSLWYTSEIWIIDRATDALVYRWGNPAAYSRGTSQTRQLFRQHDPNWLDNGNIMIFNNGDRRQRLFSSVVEIVPPLEADGRYRIEGDSAYEPLAPVWEYRAQPQTDFFAQHISGAQALPNGNVLITDGPAGRIFEVTREGRTVWQFEATLLAGEGTAAPIFKARRYLPEYIPQVATP